METSPRFVWWLSRGSVQPGGALTPAEELQETDKRPVNASLLTMLVLVAIASFGASILWLLTIKARRRGAICSWGVVEDGRWLTTASEVPSFLGVFRL